MKDEEKLSLVFNSVSGMLEMYRSRILFGVLQMKENLKTHKNMEHENMAQHGCEI